MTTPLAKPVTRKTSTPYRGRPLIVALYPGDIIGLRQLRTRKEYRLPLAWIYEMAVKAEVARSKAERAKKKRKKKEEDKP